MYINNINPIKIKTLPNIIKLIPKILSSISGVPEPFVGGLDGLFLPQSSYVHVFLSPTHNAFDITILSLGHV